MYIRKQMTPFEFLRDEAWSCGDLADLLIKNKKVDVFNQYIEDLFLEDSPTSTALNDYLRFNQAEIKEMLGITEY